MALSMGLFSSNDIDAGTRLLLKTLAKETALDAFENIVDIGCGVGTIGLGLKAFNSQARVLMRDRDALAVEFSRWNARMNKLDVTVEQELFLEGLEPNDWDLMVTNIPAKAGDEVIEDFFLRFPNYLTPGGVMAVVIVTPLREQAEALIASCGLELLYQEHTKMHSVFHLTRADSRGESEGLTPYIRHRGDFELCGREYELDTVYNVPDFDMVGWKQYLAAELLKPQNKGGTWCFVNPGQGHIPVYFHEKSSPGAERIILAGRDLLQLRISAHNMKRRGFSGDVEEQGVHDLAALANREAPGSLDLLCVDLEKPIPRTPWVDPLKDAAQTLLKKGGFLCLYGKSSDLHQIVKSGNRGFTPVDDAKFRGNRGILLRKN